MTVRRIWQTAIWGGIILGTMVTAGLGQTNAAAPTILRQAYLAVINAELAQRENRVPDALAAYRTALGLYGRLQAEYPGWQGDAVSYRVVACHDAIALLESGNLTNASPAQVAGGANDTSTVARLDQLVRELGLARAALLAEGDAQGGRSDAAQLEQELERVRGERDQAVKANQSLLRRLGKLEARASRREPDSATNASGRAVSGALKADARRMMESGDNLGAMALLQEASLLLPDDADLTVLLGVAACRGGRYQDAVAILKPFDVKAGKNADALLTLGTAYMGLGRVGEARVVTEKALAAEPKSAEANYNMAQILLAVTPPDAFLAQRHYKRAVELGLPADADLENSLRVAMIMARVKRRSK